MIMKKDPYVVNDYTPEEEQEIKKQIQEMMVDAIKNDPEYKKMKEKEPATIRYYWQRLLTWEEILHTRQMCLKALEDATNQMQIANKTLQELDKVEAEIHSKTGNTTMESFNSK